MKNYATEICKVLQHTRYEHSMANNVYYANFFFSFQFCIPPPPVEESLGALNKNTNEVGLSINRETTKYLEINAKRSNINRNTT